jgi:hypothetical protein
MSLGKMQNPGKCNHSDMMTNICCFCVTLTALVPPEKVLQKIAIHYCNVHIGGFHPKIMNNSGRINS